MAEGKNKTTEFEGERIAKVLARAGVCSRRDAERYIAEGRVSVNGKVIDSPALNVTTKDKIKVDGKPLQEAEATRLFLFHKPEGTVTTARDEMGRETIYDVLPKELPRVISVGRLDMNTEGLLLLTNDGELARWLELPSTGWIRRYRVRAFGKWNDAMAERLQNGMTIDGVKYGPIEAVLDKVQGGNVWLTLALREGKNREIRKVMEALNLKVNRLIRLSYGPFQLGHLPRGAVEEVKGKIMREQLAPFFKNEPAKDMTGQAKSAASKEQSQKPAAGARSRAGASSKASPSKSGPSKTAQAKTAQEKTLKPSSKPSGKKDR